MAFRKFAFQALVASSVVVCASVATAQPSSTQALVGTWNLTLTSPQGTHPATVTITEEAGKLAGVMAGALGSLPVVVKATETGVSLAFTVDYQGQPLPIVMAGKVDGATIKGTVDYGNGAATGDFTGTKGGAAPAAVPAAVPSAASAAAPAPASSSGVAGAWDVIGEGGGGYSFNFTQDGAAVSGTLKTPDGAELPVKGTFEGSALMLAVVADSFSGTIKGTLEGAALKGSYDLGGNTGSWSATRKP